MKTPNSRFEVSGGTMRTEYHAGRWGWHFNTTDTRLVVNCESFCDCGMLGLWLQWQQRNLCELLKTIESWRDARNFVDQNDVPSSLVILKWCERLMGINMCFSCLFLMMIELMLLYGSMLWWLSSLVVVSVVKVCWCLVVACFLDSMSSYVLTVVGHVFVMVLLYIDFVCVRVLLWVWQFVWGLSSYAISSLRFN